MTMVPKLEGSDLEIADCLMLFHEMGQSAAAAVSARCSRRFECKTCGKKFPTFQSLGGHRASHNKPKLSPVVRDDVPVSDKENQSVRVSSKKRKRHTCPICGLEFDMGQALGGHMRKHRSEMEDKCIVLKSQSQNQNQNQNQRQTQEFESDNAEYNNSNSIPEKIQRCDDVADGGFRGSDLKSYQLDEDSHGEEKDDEEGSDLTGDSSEPVFKTSTSKRGLGLDLNLTPSENFLIAKNHHL